MDDAASNVLGSTFTSNRPLSFRTKKTSYIIQIVIIVVICISFKPCGLLLRRYRRNGYFFRPPKKPKRKAIDTHPGIAEPPQGRYHDTTELMTEGSPGEMGLGGHHETVEMEGSLSQPKQMAATGSTSMKWGTTSPEIHGFEKNRRSMEIHLFDFLGYLLFVLGKSGMIVLQT